MLGIDKENKIRNYYSINEKEQRQSPAVTKIIWILLHHIVYGISK
jgi:hypothetical protein